MTLISSFQARLFLGITRLLLWLKSTLLLKNRMQSYNYSYENTMFTNKWDAALFGKKSALGAIGGEESVALIKSLI